ncbi:MAG: DNRLRE domain-containing protein, partial [Lachnospira sp.]
ILIVLKIYGFFDGTKYNRFFSGKTVKAITSVILCLCMTAPMLTPPVITGAATNSTTGRSVNTDFDIDTDKAVMSSAENKKEELTKAPVKYYKQAEPEGELVAASDTSRTYKTGERTYVTRIAGTATEYKKKDGTYSRIDNTLIEKNGNFQNRANDYTVKLPSEISDGKGITVSKNGKKSIEIIPAGGDFSKSRTSDNAILYNSVFDGVDYQYTVLEDKIKEDIILNKHTDRNTFKFIIRAAGYNVILKNNAVLIYEEDEKTPVYTVAAPVMTDASGNVCFDIKLSMDNSEVSSEYVITMTANSQWLDAVERAYPVRIDPTITIDSDCIGLYCVEQGAENIVIGDNNFPYCGYDDGITSGNLELYGQAHLMTRTYVSLDYDFSQISTEANINSASFKIYQYTGWSGGATNFCLYTADEEWNRDSLTWASQTDMSHTYVSMCSAPDGAGWLNFDITDTVNSWVQGLAYNNGLVIKAEEERDMQAEVFHNKNGANPPEITIEWSVPDPVDTDYPLDEITVNLRPMTEKSMEGQLQFDAVFADGTATPESEVNYYLTPGTEAESSGTTIAGMSYKYPDNTMYEEQLPNATKYKSKDSNWQSILFSAMLYDTTYKVIANAGINESIGAERASDSFVIYKIKQTDTLPYIANYYGVSLDQIMRDNKVADTLLVENNTIFIRNPQTEEPYSPEEPDEDAKKAIDSALMGRGFHCEYGYEPVNLNTGNFILEAQDASITEYNSEFTIDRTYNAKRSESNSLFGRGWSFSYDEKLGKNADGSISYSAGDGKVLCFKPDGNGGYTSPDNYNYIITQEPYTQDEETLIKYRITDSDGSFKVFNAWGLLESITDAYGKTTSVSYDDKYQINKITSAYDNSYVITHDGYGRISSITLPNGAVTEYKYDDGGNLVEYKDANGNVIRYEYDAHHRMTEWYDQDDIRIITNVYDDNDRVTKQTDADGNIVTFTYSEGETRTTDSNGNITIYNYDEYYRTAKVTYSYGRIEEYSYDASGNLSSDSDYSYTYDNNGNLLSKVRKDGRSVNYTYNERNQITQYTDYSGNKTSYSYDASGNLTEVTYADGSKTAYEYDELNRLVKESGQDGNTVIRSYTGALVSSCTDANGNTASYSYNSMGQLITLTDAAGNITRYMRDMAGNQTGTQAPDGGLTTYTLNKSGNVTAVTDALGYRTDFEYDGNRNIVKGTDPEGNVVTCTYDGNGNKLDSTDAAGNKTVYTYDAGNRLVKTVTADGAVTTNTYNTDGLLTKI